MGRPLPDRKIEKMSGPILLTGGVGIPSPGLVPGLRRGARGSGHRRRVARDEGVAVRGPRALAVVVARGSARDWDARAKPGRPWWPDRHNP